MRRFKARDVYNYTYDQIWALEDGPLVLEFDDGDMQVWARPTIFSWHMAEFHRRYPQTPCLMRHHLGNEDFGKATQLKVLGYCLWDCFDACGAAADMEELSTIAYDVTNNIYNDVVTRLKAHINSISIIDFLDLYDSEEVAFANSEVRPNHRSIEQAYTRLRQAIQASVVKHNPITKVVRANPKTLGQLLQCIGPRGFLTDSGGDLFAHPIISGFFPGLYNLHDHMIESRSASKALFNAKDPVAESEYFNRKLQLGTATLSDLVAGDCGTKEGIPFRVSAKDLGPLEGKYYIKPDGSLMRVEKDDRALIGRVIHMRSVLKCKHPSQYGFCQACFGELGYSVPKGTNIGHVSTTVLCEEISQNILSTKHLDTSAVSASLNFSDFDRQFLREGNDDNTIKLAVGLLKNHTVHITVAQHEAMDLGLLGQQPYTTMPPNKFSELSDIKITLDKGTMKEWSTVLAVSKGNLKSSFTTDALGFIAKSRLDVTDSDYGIDLTGWQEEDPLFVLPMRHTSMVDYMKTIETFFKSSRSAKKTTRQGPSTLRDYSTAEEALIGFYELASEKLSVNMAHLEVIVASAMIRSSNPVDHRLPITPADGEVGSYEDNMALRSLSATMAFEKHDKHLLDVRSFVIRNRPNHPMDAILCPLPQDLDN